MRRLMNLFITGIFCAYAVLSLLPTERIYEGERIEMDGTAPTVVLSEEQEKKPILAIPSVSAKGWVLMEASSGRVIAGEDIHTPLAVASTTKILTALMALETPNLREPFMVGDEILVEGSNMGLALGDHIDLYGLAAGMLLESGNDAANATAKKIAGSETAFGTMMNERAAKIGMENSYFTTPSGLDKDNNHSTAYDMGLLAIEAIQNEDFLNLCSSKKITVQKGTPPVSVNLYNHNRLLDLYPSAIGIKTGFTKKAGRCLVTAAEQDGLTLVMVTLGASDDFNTHEQVYEWAFQGLSYRRFESYIKDNTLAVVGGEEKRVPLKLQGDFGAYMLSSEASQVKVRIELPAFEYAPIVAGHRIGKVALLKGDNLLAKADLVAGEDVAEVKMGAIQRIMEKISAML